MGNWNHRILAHKDHDEWYYQIHEVYYDDNGNPSVYTENGVAVGSESLEGMIWVLDKMKDCLDKPILYADGFPKEMKSYITILDQLKRIQVGYRELYKESLMPNPSWWNSFSRKDKRELFKKYDKWDRIYKQERIKFNKKIRGLNITYERNDL